MEDTVNNSRDTDVVNVVPQSEKVFVHTFLVTGIIVGVFIIITTNYKLEIYLIALDECDIVIVTYEVPDEY